jgi:hypothetical protein
VHPFPSVPVIVYTVLADGSAETTEPDVADKPFEGLHVYTEAPLADRTAGDPPGIHTADVEGLIITEDGKAFTVTFVSEVQEPPQSSVTVHATV